ncbi:hypothetical protein ARMSODRAFT_802369 [Armillaria solidipes]|uniref:F-box domain-containing protein n=1 Tax=Armillaria solidipes TaxID=1076256 RepID=A0A2H3B3X7_9AGAR|nr:hypothetical protein ARMSODRAFT_802369 [Armillaria solidipes]
MPAPGLPPEILDAIIDELREDKKSLLQVSLACRALCLRTRVHLFHIVTLSEKSCCDRLRALITLSPKLALHFTHLRIAFDDVSNVPTATGYEALTVIESLINVTHLFLFEGYWRHIPDAVVSSLQSHSYHTLAIYGWFMFRSIGDICSLVQNSPNLQKAHFDCQNMSFQECNFNHYLRRTPAPAAVNINYSSSYSDSAGAILTLSLSSNPCLFSCRQIHTLKTVLPNTNTGVTQDLGRYLALSGTSLKHLHVSHDLSEFENAPSIRLNVSDLELLGVTIFEIGLIPLCRTSQIFEWWITNLSAVSEHCAIRSIAFIIMSCDPNCPSGHPALDWEDLWTKLDGCLSSRKMALLEHVAITFKPQPVRWDTFKTRMEGKFLGLRQLGCEVALDAVDGPWDPAS